MPTETVVEYNQFYLKLADALRAEPWFASSGEWDCVAGLYPGTDSPKSAYIQVYKQGWFNEDGRGIHFESWMTNADVARSTCNVVLHIESSKERTGINGKTLVQHLLAAEKVRISGWEGYQIKESYTMQPFIRKLGITRETFVPVLLDEFARLGELADSVDKAILAARI